MENTKIVKKDANVSIDTIRIVKDMDANKFRYITYTHRGERRLLPDVKFTTYKDTPIRFEITDNLTGNTFEISHNGVVTVKIDGKTHIYTIDELFDMIRGD